MSKPLEVDSAPHISTFVDAMIKSGESGLHAICQQLFDRCKKFPVEETEDACRFLWYMSKNYHDVLMRAIPGDKAYNLEYLDFIFFCYYGENIAPHFEVGRLNRQSLEWVYARGKSEPVATAFYLVARNEVDKLGHDITPRELANAYLACLEFEKEETILA